MVSPFRFPRPRSCLKIISLRTATEFINLTLMINKVTGFYGILAIFTGYELNPLQLSHYIYSLVILALVASLAPSLRNPQAPLKNLALAWVYVLDTAINGAYTALFSAGWFLLLAQHLQERLRLLSVRGAAAGLDAAAEMAKGTMSDTAGFTDPQINASRVEVVATPAPGLWSGQSATAYAAGEGGSSGPGGALGGAVLQSDSLTSIALLACFFVVRVYFCLIVLTYARGMLRQYVALTAATTASGYSDATDPTMAESPFRADREKGMGWSGRLGRLMTWLPSRRYWLGREESDRAEWERATSGRFETGRKPLRIKVPDSGVGERERRARSGTGPPPPPPNTNKQPPE